MEVDAMETNLDQILKQEPESIGYLESFTILPLFDFFAMAFPSLIISILLLVLFNQIIKSKKQKLISATIISAVTFLFFMAFWGPIETNKLKKKWLEEHVEPFVENSETAKVIPNKIELKENPEKNLIIFSHNGELYTERNVKLIMDLDSGVTPLVSYKPIPKELVEYKGELVNVILHLPFDYNF